MGGREGRVWVRKGESKRDDQRQWDGRCRRRRGGGGDDVLDGGVGVEVEVEVGVGREWREGGGRGLEKERVREDDRARLGFCCLSFFVELESLGNRMNFTWTRI